MSDRTDPESDRVELRVTSLVAGGDALGRLDDGRVVLVEGALPGETVLVEVTQRKPRLLRGHVGEVVDPSPDRVRPACDHWHEGCGGCGWLHLDLAGQRRWKAEIVAESLRRLGRLESHPEIDPGPDLPVTDLRTTVSTGVDGRGRPAYHLRRSRYTVGAPTCAVAHPLVRQVLAESRFPGASTVKIRASVATGERVVALDRLSPKGAEGRTELTRIVTGAAKVGRAPITEKVAGRTWRVSIDAFFQPGPAAAEALVAAVRAAAGPVDDHTQVLDAYGGVGLLGGSLAARTGARLRVVEWNRAAVADAEANLADLDAEVIGGDVADVEPEPADLVIADPSRDGLGRSGVDHLVATGAERIVLVSCDPASLGRDAGLLATAGFRLDALRLVDCFPQTPHVEVVSTFLRVES